MRDLVVLLEDTPGELRRLAHVLGTAGINIEGLAALTGQGQSVVHVLVADHERALMALAAADLQARASHDAVIANLPDRPDALADALAEVAAAGINIRLTYLAVGTRSATRVVLVTDDPERTRTVLDTRGLPT